MSAANVASTRQELNSPLFGTIRFYSPFYCTHLPRITYQFDGQAPTLFTVSALALFRFCLCSASLLACVVPAGAH